MMQLIQFKCTFPQNSKTKCKIANTAKICDNKTCKLQDGYKM